MKKVKVLDLEQAVAQVLDCRMNHRAMYPGEKISKLIEYMLDGKDKTLKTLKEKKKEDEQDFNYYYGEDFLDKLETFFDVYENRKVLSGNNEFDIVISNYQSFNYGNYQELKKANLLYLIREFDDYFRGDIKKIYKVYTKWTIIETYKDDEGKKFYSTEYTSNCFDNFEDALFYAMNEHQAEAMGILYKAKEV